MTANTPKSRKAKDHNFKMGIARDLTSVLHIGAADIVVPPSSCPGCDIILSPKALERFPFGVECKRQETLSIPAWWKQCETNASKVDLTPLLVFKRNREEPLAVLRWTDLLSLLRHDHRWENLAEGLTGGRP